ncbi:hypothetical protein [Streptomyces sp. NPDC051561]|uniref:hypothetical protein n=1 Tax=Streptomyces sp. NPDC051561 TaxID=3365658 RepID=UPI0037A96E22
MSKWAFVVTGAVIGAVAGPVVVLLRRRGQQEPVRLLVPPSRDPAAPPVAGSPRNPPCI